MTLIVGQSPRSVMGAQDVLRTGAAVDGNVQPLVDIPAMEPEDGRPQLLQMEKVPMDIEVEKIVDLSLIHI